MNRRSVRSLLVCLVFAQAAFTLDLNGAPADPSILLTASPVDDGGNVRLSISSPYRGRNFSLWILTPSIQESEAVSGTLDSRGEAIILLNVRSGALAANLNSIFRASVEPKEDGARRFSAPCRLKLSAPGGEPRGSPDLVQDEIGLFAELSVVISLFADLDGDGDSDIIAAVADSASSGLRVLTNDGHGSFADESDARLGAAKALSGRTLAAGDVNSDGAMDVFVGTGESSGSSILLLNDGQGILSPSAEFPAKVDPGFRANGALFADFDSDGDLDLFVSQGISGSHGTPAAPQTNELYLNDGQGRFALALPPISAIAEPAVSRGAAAGDVDGDGDLDLVVATSAADQLFLNDGSGGFENRSDKLPSAVDSTYGAALVDLDLDGDLDVAYANTMFNPAAQAILLNQGGAQGGAEGDFAVGDFPPLAAGQSPIRLGLTAADVDSDGDTDLFFAIHELGAGEKPDLYLNQGGVQNGAAGTFALAENFPLPSGVFSTLPVDDVDGDGDLDVLSASTGALLFRNRLFADPDAPLGFQRGDTNSDGARDLSDAISTLGFLFLGEGEPACLLAADANDSGEVDLSDAVSLLSFLYLGGNPTPAPYPGFGDDTTPGDIPCRLPGIFDVVR